MRLPIVVVAALAAALLAGCSIQKTEDDGARRPGRWGDRNPHRLGATDQHDRRPAGVPGSDIFDALDLPTPTERRLASGAPGPAYWQQQADYTIDCELDADTKRLDATERVVYHNNSPHELTYMWVQLEQNLFRTDSLGTLSRGRGVMRPLEENFNGGYDIAYLRANGVDLEYHVYDTLARVELPRPIRPGETFTFELAYAFDMPPHLRRMGSEDVEQGTIFEYAQWFPSVCNYDDVNGWNTLQYLGSGEFYTNYGDYTVNITVPRSHLVAATGVLQNPGEVLTDDQRARLDQALASDETRVIRSVDEVADPATRPAGMGKLTWRFRAENVRTFAWASSEAFAWDACGADVTDLNGGKRRVLCQSFYPKEAESWYWNDDGRGSSQAIKHTIEFNSGFVYPYPYPVMSNINGPEGGMEYPMIVFCGSRTNDDGMFGVTDHEVGHTWFPMVVNTDERRHMWQDEGFNTFDNLYSKADWFGRTADIADAIRQENDIATALNRQRVDVPPDRQWSRWIGSLNYRKTALALYLLREDVLGHERFDCAFKTYVRRWAFKSPQPADFFRTMEDAAGMDLAWYWRGWFLSDATLNQGVTITERPDNDGVVVELTNKGEMVMPVNLRVTYADGSTRDERLPVDIWATTNRWRAWVGRGGGEVVRVELDPEGIYPDTDRSDNSAEPKG